MDPVLQACRKCRQRQRHEQRQIESQVVAIAVVQHQEQNDWHQSDNIGTSPGDATHKLTRAQADPCHDQRDEQSAQPAERIGLCRQSGDILAQATWNLKETFEEGPATKEHRLLNMVDQIRLDSQPDIQIAEAEVSGASGGPKSPETRPVPHFVRFLAFDDRNLAPSRVSAYFTLAHLILQLSKTPPFTHFLRSLVAGCMPLLLTGAVAQPLFDDAATLVPPLDGVRTIAVGDVDNDGWPDLFTTSHTDGGTLLLNEGGARWTDRSRRMPANLSQAIGAVFGDMDDDGDLDLLLAQVSR
ncbi:MAG TPA: hypothetical protein DIC52_20265, partial [Candidatus Latescibacteria bacterium]|nr:hypothetical protein [Candidatus Latescibacterota bacterium]